jgi:hypothetical protein
VQAELVERARRGDREAFAVLAGGAVDRLYATARLVLRDADLAQDATQEALVRAWRDLLTLRDVERFDGGGARRSRSCRANRPSSIAQASSPIATSSNGVCAG